VLGGFLEIAKTPSSWPWALLPALILLVLSALLVVAALAWLRPVVEHFFAEPAGLYATTVALLVGVLASLLGLFVALALTPPLSAPALERVVALVEHRLGAPPRQPLGMFAEMWCGLKAQLAAAAVAGPILLGLWVVDLFVAPAAVVTVPLKALVASFALAWNLFDYPLTLRGVRIRNRLALIRSHKSAVIGFGAGFSLLFWVPCFGVLLLPAGVAGATQLLWRILRTDRSLLPELSRP
jgi:CysZ protein